MEPFGHYFEFFAALNSAYIVSDLFYRIISKEVMKSYSEIKGGYKVLHSQFREVVDQVYKSDSVGIAAHQVSELEQRRIETKNSMDEFKDEIRKSRKKPPYIRNFNYICLYSAFYCITILVCNGFSFNLGTSRQTQSFLIFNFVSIFLMILLMFGWWPKKVNHITIIFVFFGALILTCPIDLWVTQSFLKIQPDSPMAGIEKIFCLCVPVAHFPYYFFRIRAKIRNDKKVLSEKLGNINLEVHDYSVAASTIFPTIKSLQKVKE